MVNGRKTGATGGPAKAANRRALLDAATALIGRDGTRVRLEAIAEIRPA